MINVDVEYRTQKRVFVAITDKLTDDTLRLDLEECAELCIKVKALLESENNKRWMEGL